MRLRTAALRALVACAVLTASPVLAAARAANPDLLPDCTYGASAPGLRGFEARVQRDAWAYADQVTGEPRLTAARAFAAAEVAYVYGFRWSTCTTPCGCSGSGTRSSASPR
ncbi:MAG: hypothetical protein JWN31_2129 [Frankiales bacterium]|nr:hypothetical protein [Frankiales bacterium]